MDLSDGLASDLPRLCAASKVGARIEADRLPVSAESVRRLGLAGATRLAWVGGEDYELLLSVPTRRAAAFERACREAGERITEIGECIAGSRIQVGGKLSSGGSDWPRRFEHF